VAESDSEDKLVIVTSCLLLATASLLSEQLSRRQRTVWGQSYLRTKLSIMCIAAYYLTWQHISQGEIQEFPLYGPGRLCGTLWDIGTTSREENHKI